MFVERHTELRCFYESSHMSLGFNCFREILAYHLTSLAVVSNDFTPTVLGITAQHVEKVYIECDREKHEWLVVKGKGDFRSKVSTHF